MLAIVTEYHSNYGVPLLLLLHSSEKERKQKNVVLYNAGKANAIIFILMLL